MSSGVGVNAHHCIKYRLNLKKNLKQLSIMWLAAQRFLGLISNVHSLESKSYLFIIIEVNIWLKVTLLI